MPKTPRVENETPKFKTKQAEIDYLWDLLKKYDDKIGDLGTQIKTEREKHLIDQGEKIAQTMKDCFADQIAFIDARIEEAQKRTDDSEQVYVRDSEQIKINALKELRSEILFKEISRVPGYQGLTQTASV